MIYLKLFLTFLKIGAVSFGGGYGMISLINEECIGAGWLTEEELLNMIAVSESTPGPIAVNIATFVGSSQAGVLGALLATLGIILPAFLIMLLIAACIGNLLRFAGVKATLGAVHPAVTGLIFSMGLTMGLNLLLGIQTVQSTPSFDWRALVILAVLSLTAFLAAKCFKRKLSPIVIILISGIIGFLLYGL